MDQTFEFLILGLDKRQQRSEGREKEARVEILDRRNGKVSRMLREEGEELFKLVK